MEVSCVEIFTKDSTVSADCCTFVSDGTGDGNRVRVANVEVFDHSRPTTLSARESLMPACTFISLQAHINRLSPSRARSVPTPSPCLHQPSQQEALLPHKAHLPTRVLRREE